VVRETAKEEGVRHLLLSFARWFDSWAGAEEIVTVAERRLDGFRVVPFLALHLACLGIFAVGWSPVAVWTAVALYIVRMFAVTGIYHRYFCHNAYRLSRPVQFLFAVLGSTAVQRGPLWWAAHHRHHHRYAVSARQGFYGWEVDVTYCILRALALVGIVRDLEPVPEAVLSEGRRIDAAKQRR